MFKSLINFFSKKKQVKSKTGYKEVPDIKVLEDESLYDALEKRGLLVRPRFPYSLGKKLIKDGELGLTSNNGNPRFLAPGRYTLWSIFNKYHDTVSIDKEVIEVGSIQIVTISQGKIGLAVKNGVNQILEPGRYILHAPHVFVKAVPVNSSYVELGTHKRIIVPPGHVAIDKNGQHIITAEETKIKPYITDSPIFSFDPQSGFKSIQLQEVQLDQLVVNTHEMIALNVVGVIRYKITDPVKAFLNMQNVHSAIKLQAEATLTSVFAQLSIDQIRTSISSVTVDKKENEASYVPDDLIHQATDLFVSKFKQVVASWGVDLETLNILSMTFNDESFIETLQLRAKSRMETDTNLANLKTKTEVALQEAEREKQKQIIEANARAEATKINADAELYAAKKQQEASKLLSEQPFAQRLTILKQQTEMAKVIGDKGNTVFMSHGLSLENVGIKDQLGRTFFGGVKGAQERPKVIQRSLSMSNM